MEQFPVMRWLLDYRGRVFSLVAVLLYWYLSSYVLLMDWRFRAYDIATTRFAESSYRMAHVEVGGFPGHEFTTAYRMTCWANLVFGPVDTGMRWLKKTVGSGDVPDTTGRTASDYDS